MEFFFLYMDGRIIEWMDRCFVVVIVAIAAAFLFFLLLFFFLLSLNYIFYCYLCFVYLLLRFIIAIIHAGQMDLLHDLTFL